MIQSKRQEIFCTARVQLNEMNEGHESGQPTGAWQQGGSLSTQMPTREVWGFLRQIRCKVQVNVSWHGRALSFARFNKARAARFGTEVDRS